MLVALSVLAMASVSLAATASEEACIHSFGNATFNLAPLRKAGGYVVQDSRNNKQTLQFSYNFNICANIANQLNPNCDSGDPRNTNPSPAYQVWDGGDQCERLAGNIEQNQPQWSLYNAANPAMGVSVTYPGGSDCGNAGDRSFTVHVLCYDDADSSPDKQLIYENDECHYELFLRSAWGCPVECPVSSADTDGELHLCGDHGICAYDTSASKSHCYCNDGHAGEACTPEEKKHGLDAVGVVLIVTAIFLVLLLALLWFLWSKISSLRLDPSAYRGLAAHDAETGNAEPADIYDD